MTLPVFRSVTTGGDSSGTNLSVTAPAGLTNGDLIFCVIYAETTAAITATGWTEITGAGGANSTTFVERLFWKRASGEGASWTFSWGGANVWRGYVCTAYSSGLESGDPTEAPSYAESESGTATITGTGITTLGSDRKVVFAGVFYYSSATSFGTPNQGTRRGNIAALAFLCDQDVAAAGATGNYTIQANNTESGRWSAGVVAMLGATGGGTPSRTGRGMLTMGVR